MVKNMPIAELVTIPVGHNIHAQRPSEFLTVVNYFLNSHSAE